MSDFGAKRKNHPIGWFFLFAPKSDIYDEEIYEMKKDAH
jgi:hypothetical protein